MTPVGKALWFIESHLGTELTLDDIAAAAGVTRYHVTRAFGAATGRSVMRYVRERRLSRAALLLREGAPDILAVALDAGYGSHEAFTRAFRDHFAATPEAVRAQRSLDRCRFVEPIAMTETILADLAPPRFETVAPMTIAGLRERYSCESSKAIPSQWLRLQPYLGHVDGQRGKVAYGVRFNPDDDGDFDYLCGVEVADLDRLPQGFSHVRIPRQLYAVFAHGGHISTIRSVVTSIWSHWLPESGLETAEAPDFERYGPEFDPRTGNGGFEIWVPVRSSTMKG